MQRPGVSVPKLASVHSADELIHTCDVAEGVGAEVELDCTATTQFDPLGIAVLASSIAQRRANGFATRIILPRSVSARDFLEEVGLDAFAEGRSTGIGTLEVRQMSALDASYTEAVTRMLILGVPGVTEDDAYPIQLCLNELLQNVFEWAGSSVGSFVLARWYHQTRSVRLAVVDRGIGIPAALRGSAVTSMHALDDVEIVRAAVEMPRLTSRLNRVGGYGLKHVREVVLDRGGRLTVMSLKAKLIWSPDAVESRVLPRFAGTAIELEFRPDVPVEHPDDYVPVF